jgi:hypothetical protein
MIAHAFRSFGGREKGEALKAKADEAESKTKDLATQAKDTVVKAVGK